MKFNLQIQVLFNCLMDSVQLTYKIMSILGADVIAMNFGHIIMGKICTEAFIAKTCTASNNVDNDVL